MRKICHISHSSHEEAMFRSEADINYAFNCFALACLETDSSALADSEMTTHVHFGASTDSPEELFAKYRYKYSRYFGKKYGRSGRFGERHPYILEVSGILHTQTMLSYVFRQGLHHGLASTPFGYLHNSVNAIYKEDLGKSLQMETLPRSRWAQYLPAGTEGIPDGYRMSTSGLLLREDVIDTGYVEQVFITPRNFLYQMNRLSSDAWKDEQAEDKNGLPPVTLECVEPSCFKASMSQLLLNENGRNVRNGITDLELCNLIDTEYLIPYSASSIYELTPAQRAEVGNRIYLDIRKGVISRKLGRNAGIPDKMQLIRCLAI